MRNGEDIRPAPGRLKRGPEAPSTGWARTARDGDRIAAWKDLQWATSLIMGRFARDLSEDSLTLEEFEVAASAKGAAAPLELPQQDKPSFKALGTMQVREIGDTQYTLRFHNVTLEGPGTCRLRVRIGQQDEIVAAEISVLLRTHEQRETS